MARKKGSGFQGQRYNSEEVGKRIEKLLEKVESIKIEAQIFVAERIAAIETSKK